MCFVQTVFYYVKRLIFYCVKRDVVLSTQCLIVLKDYVIMLNARVVLYTQCLIILKRYVIMLNARVVLFTQCYHKRLCRDVRGWVYKACALVCTTCFYVIGACCLLLC